MYTRFRHRSSAALLAALLVVAAAGCDRAGGPVGYARDVAPILDGNCASCHAPGAPGYEASAFSVKDHAAVMKGGKSGPVVRAGDPSASRLVVLIEGRDPALKMPHVEGMDLSAAQIETIRRWIQQGAKND